MMRQDRAARGWLRWGLLASAVIWLVACAGNPTGQGRNGLLLPAAPSGTLVGRTAVMDPDAAVERIIHKMTLDQKIGQMLMVEIFVHPQYDDYLGRYIREAHVGGCIIYNMDPARNDAPVPTTAETFRQMMDGLQAHADFPLLLALDQEGGDVNRLGPYFGTAPSVAQLGATGNPQRAFAEGQLDAQRLAQIGINVNLAPDVDVSDGQGGGVDPSRMWGTTPSTIISYAGAYLDGLQAAGMPGTLKHWPGIGAVHSDPHFSLPVLNHSLDQLNTIDFPPFKTLMTHGPALIMSTHVIVPAVEANVPATLSQKMVTGILRQQLGYQGVIITDQLHMAGIRDYMQKIGITDFLAALGEAGVQSVIAGNDILEGAFDPYSAQVMLNSIKTAVQNGRIPLARIEESDRRILRLKMAYNIGTAQLLRAAGPAPMPATPGAALVASSSLAVTVADVTR